MTSETQSANEFVELTNKIAKTEKIGMLLTNQYPGINSKGFKEFLQASFLTMVFTAANALLSDGLNERLNYTLVNKIRCKMNENKNKEHGQK